ncbi:MAG: hypothetical protein ACP5OA_04030 [Candidatus Woesearchaeota archaeon]
MKLVSVLIIGCLILCVGCSNKLQSKDNSEDILSVINSFHKPVDLKYVYTENITEDEAFYGEMGVGSVTTISFFHEDLKDKAEYEQRSIIYTIMKINNTEKFKKYYDVERQSALLNDNSTFQELFNENNKFLWIYSVDGDLILENIRPSQEVDNRPFSYFIQFSDENYTVGIELHYVFKKEKDVILMQVEQYLKTN